MGNENNSMISRRAFLSMAGASALARPARVWGRSQSVAAIDPARLRRHLQSLSTYGRPAGGTFASGVSRVAYSVADVTARAWLLEVIKEAGVAPRLDAAGNIYARLGGTPSRAPILFGSHIDSVPNGGNFDGDLGVMAAIEVLHAVQAAQITTRHPLEFVLWAHEESTAFGTGTACSRIVAGDLKPGDMAQVWNGMTRADALRRIGGDPDRIETAVRPMKPDHHSAPSGGKSLPSRSAMFCRAQCSTPCVSKSRINPGTLSAAPGRNGGGVPTTVRVIKRSGRRAAKARAIVPPILAPTRWKRAMPR